MTELVKKENVLSAGWAFLCTDQGGCELPDVFSSRNVSGKSSVGTLFFMNRPPLPSPGRHFQLLAVANSVGIEKPTMGSPGEDNRCYLLTLLTDP